MTIEAGSAAGQERRFGARARLMFPALLLIQCFGAAAHAQVTLDLSKVTCEQLVLYRITNSENITIWLQGYYSGRNGNTVVDTPT